MSDDMAWTKQELGYAPPEVDTSVPHSARIYDYVLGGKDNYPPDREAAERMLAISPALRTSMHENRKFMHRVVRYLTAERGIRQFLDIGTGIPTSPNLHEVASGIAPDVNVVYVDNDPIVFTHAQARMTGTPESRIAYLNADLRDPDAILTSPRLHATLDLSRPVALTIIAVFQVIVDDQQAHDLMKRYLDPLAPGSFLALSTVTTDSNPKRSTKMIASQNANGIPTLARNLAEVTAFFDGLELVDPGVVLAHRWRPEQGAELPKDSDITMYAGVALKR